MTSQTINLTRFLSEEIRNKYEFFVKSDFETTANMSVDSLFPKLFNAKINNETVRVSDITFPTSSFAISEFVANSLEVRKAHISELCKVLNFTEAHIKGLLLSVKRKKFDLYLIGFGGTGVNFNYWLKELAEWTHTVNIFNTVTISDNDIFSLSNVVRLPFDTRKYLKPAEKVHMFDNSSHIVNKIDVTTSTTHAVSRAQLANARRNTIFYGAPDIGTRKTLSEMEDVKFISATHSGNEAQLYLNPPQDDDLQIETYGQINLSVFFMNHLMMTIRFLEFLANSENVNWNSSGEIMEYNFKEEYNNERTNQGGRLYRFPCLTVDEQEAVDTRNRTAQEGQDLVGIHQDPSQEEIDIQTAEAINLEEGHINDTFPDYNDSDRNTYTEGTIVNDRSFPIDAYPNGQLRIMDARGNWNDYDPEAARRAELGQAASEAAEAVLRGAIFGADVPEAENDETRGDDINQLLNELNVEARI